ncbi:DUF2946 domain-containing protein [Bacillus sp. NP157]|nr:DUF2946 domain-containing protein [Bacillus sp. NP157]
MPLRRRPSQRIFTVLAFLAMGLLVCVPVISRAVRTSANAMGAPSAENVDGIPALSFWCHGQANHSPQARDTDEVVAHPGDPCGYCNFLANHPGLASVPAVVMRPPSEQPVLIPTPVPHRSNRPAWQLAVAPRGPPPA